MDEFEFPDGFLKVFEDLEAIDPPDSHTGTIRSAVAVDRCELKQPCVSPELMAEVPNLTRPVSPRYRILDNDGALAEWDDEINGDGVSCDQLADDSLRLGSNLKPQCHMAIWHC